MTGLGLTISGGPASCRAKMRAAHPPTWMQVLAAGPTNLSISRDIQYFTYWSKVLFYCLFRVLTVMYIIIHTNNFDTIAFLGCRNHRVLNGITTLPPSDIRRSVHPSVHPSVLPSVLPSCPYVRPNYKMLYLLKRYGTR